MAREGTRNVGLTEGDHFRAMENLQEVQHLPSISPINLNYLGAEQCEKGYSFGPFVRMSYVVHIIREGKGQLEKNGKVYPVEEGQAFLIYPGEETTYSADEEDPWSYIWVGFHGLMAEEVMLRAGFTPEAPVITCQNTDRLVSVMNDLLSCRELNFVNDLMRTGYMYQLMGLLAENATGETLPEREEDIEKIYVRTAVNLLVNSDDPQVRVSDVAKTIGISRGYLTRIFKNGMGVSPQEFQTQFRMEKATDLLRNTKNTIGSIAEELGYTDVLSFSKSFRNQFGMSPTAFREQKVSLIEREKKGSFTSEYPL